jgi:hypothetical protein
VTLASPLKHFLVLPFRLQKEKADCGFTIQSA